MKKLIVLGICLFCVPAIFAQDVKKQGDDMAADQNYSGAAMMYRLCIEIEQDEECVLKLFQLIYEKKIEPESADELFQLISPLAQKGNPAAQFYLGELYRRGLGGVSQDYRETKVWLQKSADQNYADALKAMETFYKQIGASGDEMAAAGKYDEAAAMYRLCSENDECVLKLFQLIYEEKIRPESTNELYQLVSPLAQKGNPKAQFYLGELYRKGVGGVSQDYLETIVWLRKSADQKYADARKALDMLCASGDAMAAEGNYDEAATMYRLCLENDELFQLKLFKLIYDKKTEPLNPNELHQLINPLAQKENPEAQYYLGLMYKTGLGVSSASEVEALKWFQLSANQNFADANTELEKMRPIIVEPPVKKSKLPGVLFTVGGLSAAAGIAATYFLEPKNVRLNWNNVDPDKGVEQITEYNPVYFIAGCAVGAVCIGTGFIIKNKAKKQPDKAIAENYGTQSLPQHDYDMRLHIVATGNGAGLRLTF